ncbi:hypothetical protein H696_06248 [Fonticula alba]|uniref:LIM zinc-binding domain-containing protein n=1 Tax=Fonticula alba TaxID=691883 RepID=A0A058YZB1_FONAL|nr:hypothetical protein H696_06248 [Fonticula alba]KCV67324.1 hypothetical protein H696_06248 [Fonticula alba]|eukprot:XP_009498268.1 hypothetical protein H696_06248 [Fonticula alba]
MSHFFINVYRHRGVNLHREPIRMWTKSLLYATAAPAWAEPMRTFARLLDRNDPNLTNLLPTYAKFQKMRGLKPLSQTSPTLRSLPPVPTADSPADMPEAGPREFSPAVQELLCRDGSRASRLSVDIILTNNAVIRRLNHMYQKTNAPTDVLSFPSNKFHHPQGFPIPQPPGDADAHMVAYNICKVTGESLSVFDSDLFDKGTLRRPQAVTPPARSLNAIESGFSSNDEAFEPASRFDPCHLGVIVLSVERASRDARLSNSTIDRHLQRLLAHSLLHLLGHVHETTPTAELNDAVLNSLEDILNSFQSQLEAGAFTCSGCNNTLEAKEQYTSASDRRYHQACFKCFVCQAPFADMSYVEHLGKVYCEEDFAKTFGVSCSGCKEIIVGEMVRPEVLQGTGPAISFHPGCFACPECKKSAHEAYILHEGLPYCPEDYHRLFSPRCDMCAEVLAGSEHINWGASRVHMDCFKCETCSVPLHGAKAYRIDDRPYCEVHYHLLRGIMCAACESPIVGPCLKAMEKDFHPGCFVCETCKEPLSGTFAQVGGTIARCHPCNDSA